MASPSKKNHDRKEKVAYSLYVLWFFAVMCFSRKALGFPLEIMFLMIYSIAMALSRLKMGDKRMQKSSKEEA